jgi:hypothetical protein
MLEYLSYKTVKLGWEGDIGIRTRVDLTAVQWLDKRDACFLTFSPPQKGSFCSERESNKARHMVDYNCHMVSVDKEDRVANSYSTAIRHGNV